MVSRDEDVNQKILNLIQSTSPAKSTIQTYFLVALRNGIGLVVVMSLLSLIFTYLCYQLYKQVIAILIIHLSLTHSFFFFQFGWNIYKRIGADIQQQHRFKLTQIFFLLLKLDAFFQLVLCIFYTVVMSQEAYYAMWSVDKKKFVGYVVHFVVTALLIPALLLARHSVITENKAIMGLFQASQIIMIVDFIVVLVDSAGSWVFWILAGKTEQNEIGVLLNKSYSLCCYLSMLCEFKCYYYYCNRLMIISRLLLSLVSLYLKTLIKD